MADAISSMLGYYAAAATLPYHQLLLIISLVTRHDWFERCRCHLLTTPSHDVVSFTYAC